MGLEYKELNDAQWVKELNQISDDSVFSNLTYLTCFEKAYHVSKKTVAVYQDKKPSLLLTFYEKGQRIVSPNHYSFQFIWEKEKTNSWKRIIIIEFLLKELKKRYHSIHFRFLPSIDDIRMFEWEGFTYTLKYTYLKTLDDIPYHQNLKRILAKPHSYILKSNSDWDEVWYKHEKDLKSFKFSQSFISETLNCFKQLQLQQLLNTYNIYQRGKLFSSIIAIVDQPQSKAYFPLIGKIDSSASGAAVHLYAFALSELKAIGIQQVDLYGANIKTIARFKHKFVVQLHHFFEVRYNKREARFRRSIDALRFVLKKLLRT